MTKLPLFKSLVLTYDKKVFSLLLSFILLGCTLNKQRNPAPITTNDVKPAQSDDHLNLKTKKNSRMKESALSPIWSKNGKLVRTSFSEISGWSKENFLGVWHAWKKNCKVMAGQNLLFKDKCNRSKKINFNNYKEIKLFFEENFTPHQIQASPNTVTGYYEPILNGSLISSKKFSYPLYKKPNDLIIKRIIKNGQPTGKWFHGRKVKTKNGDRLVPYPSRKDLTHSQNLKKYEIVYLEDPIEAFFLQIQGSGRIQLEDKTIMRLGFSASNGHPYRSIGSWLIRNGELPSSSASMQGIKNWLKKNPTRLNELLNQNPRMIFFKDLTKIIKEGDGPIGALGVPLSPGRSIAVDPNYVTLGMPVFLTTKIPKTKTYSKDNLSNGKRLVFAQDTGKAIKGPNRADLFFGSGLQAGRQAGKMKYPGTMTILIPNQT